jgi:ElaB/YqjD/DUF883 family membrane-anchored ribosome-binding protein
MAKKTEVNEKNMHDTLINLKNLLAEKTDAAKTQAMDTVTELLEDLGAVKTECKGYAQQYVKSYPLKSLGIAAALGLFLGKFIL